MTTTAKTPKTAAVTLPVAALVLDTTLFPRHEISRHNVRRIAEALRSGHSMPPVIVSDPEHVVVDGFHRVTAYEQVYGAQHPVPVELRAYNGDRAAMLADAISANVARGLDLTSWDHARCLELADQVGLDARRLAVLLRVRTTHLDNYRKGRMARTVDDRAVPLKRSLSHKLEELITPAVEAANEKLSGMQPVFHVDQLILLLENDLLPPGDSLRQRLSRLGALIAHHLSD